MRKHIQLVAPLAIVLAFVLTLPLGPVVHRGFLHVREKPDSYDFLLNTWILAWGAHAVTTPGERLFDTNAFYPRTNTLAYSDHLLGNLPLTLPILWATDNPILAHNVLLLLSFALSFACMYALAWRLTRSQAAALLGAFVFAACPYRYSNIERVQILSSQWMPLCLLFVHRFMDKGRWRDAIGAAVFAFVQAMVSCYYAILFPTFLAMWLVVLLAIQWRRRGELAGLRRRLAGVAAIFVLYALLCLPFFWPYVKLARDMGFRRDWGETLRHSADVMNYLVAPASSMLYGRVFRAWAGDGNALFPGFIVVALAAVGLVARRRTPAAWAYAAAGLACALFALGPVIRLAGRDVGPGPYALLYRFVPGYGGLRDPTRFAMPMMLSLAVLAAWGCAAAVDRAAALSRRRRQLALAALFALAAAEYWCLPLHATNVPRKFELAEPYQWLARRNDVHVVLQTPFDLDVADRWYLYGSTLHWKRLVNGVSGWSPPEDLAKYYTAANLSSRESAQLISDLGVDCIIAHESTFRTLGPNWRLLARFSDSIAVAPVLPSKGLARRLPRLDDCDRSNWAIAAHPNAGDVRLAVDGRLDTAWSTGRPQRAGDAVTLDFGQPMTVGSVHLWTGALTDQFPLFTSIEVADSRQGPFRRVTTGTGLPWLYRTCLLDHRDARVVFCFEPVRCRVLRIKANVPRRMRYPRAWSIAEVGVFPEAP